MTERIYPCPHCRTPNRLPRQRIESGEAGRIVCGKCRQPVFPAHPVMSGDAGFDAQVMQAPLPVLVDFWAPWCGPCRMLGPELDALAADTAGRLIVVKVNIDENPQLASRFAVRSVPTLLVVAAGRVVDTITGAMPKAALLQRLGPWLA